MITRSLIAAGTAVLLMHFSIGACACAGEDSRSDDDRVTPVSTPMKAWAPLAAIRAQPSDADRENYDGLMAALPADAVQPVVSEAAPSISDAQRVVHDALLAALSPAQSDAILVRESRPLTADRRVENEAQVASEPTPECFPAGAID